MPESYANEQLELVAVASKFCILLEQASQSKRSAFVANMLKVLPFLYLKMTLVREQATPSDNEPANVEERVTEDDYNFVREGVHSLLGGDDAYLDVFVDDMKYSETPICKSISEDLADIYQDVRNFVWIFGQQNEQATAEAFDALNNLFEIHWGQLVVNVMRPLHELQYGLAANDEEML